MKSLKPLSRNILGPWNDNYAGSNSQDEEEEGIFWFLLRNDRTWRNWKTIADSKSCLRELHPATGASCQEPSGPEKIRIRSCKHL
jgi:hypothetical protein